MSKTLLITPTQAIARARSQVGKLRYVLGTGGRDPRARSPGDLTAACDCSGFVCWAIGLDRKQPQFHWGWISTDSMVATARVKNNGWFDEIPRPEPGCLVVYPGQHHKGKRVRIGHVGLVVSVPAEWDVNYPDYDELRVVHCSSGNQRRTGWAVQETNGVAWSGRGSMFLRPVQRV